MSKISELGFPALYRTLVAQPGQMQLFSPRAQPAAKPVLEPIKVVLCDTPEKFLVLMEAELAEYKAWCKEELRLCLLRNVADSYVPQQLIVLPPAADE